VRWQRGSGQGQSATQLASPGRVRRVVRGQEALNNVAKHSGATRAIVTLSRLDGEVDGTRLTIEDNGSGFDPAAAGGGQLGLRIMRERADTVQAVLQIDSIRGQGTSVTVSWPPAAPAGVHD